METTTSSDGSVNVALLKRTFGQFPSGVVALAALCDDAPQGMAVSSFTSVSMSPPLVSVAIQLTSITWPLLRERPVLGLSVLGARQARVCRQLAAVGVQRFRDVQWTASASGGVLIDGAVAWLTASIDTVTRAGDHDLVLLKVHDVAAHSGTPLVFHSSVFRQLEGNVVRVPRSSVIRLLPAGDVEFDESMHEIGSSGVVQLWPAGDVEVLE